MDLAVFQELTEQITLECFFMTDSQQEEKVIQLIDLHHFIECYDSTIKVFDYIQHSINIIEDNGIKKGIFFCDLKYTAPLDLYACEAFKKQHSIKELWFVFVEEDSVSDCSRHIEFIHQNSIEIFYDKIFLFNFFQSIIKEIK
ncbi:hypothetical protein M2347_003961 [Chryseobacterium sp. H1D6B]|uniref:hypothetical protein n=1 Tax=Chryseobacterium sp. H1D6B TaxID=2940588 RepID=UPI0015CCFD0B|nr:hypothetical protein [Chryseobacterium sp. H1D6B]MDH6254234.1 hypothetical protein [Chryseobacterium sp. H1D6B]